MAYYPLSTVKDPTNPTCAARLTTGYIFVKNDGIYTDVPITDMSYMFSGETDFDEDLSLWDVSDVITMEMMFYNCNSFTSDLSLWDVSSVTTMSWTFTSCTSFNSDLTLWDVSNVTDMARMFSSCTSFNSDLTLWDVLNVTDMFHTFDGCSSFNGNISLWNVSNVIDASSMFRYCTVFNSDVSLWQTTALLDANHMFADCPVFNADVSGWTVSSISGFGNMFQNCLLFNANVSGWDVSSATRIEYIFYNCPIFNANVSGWDVSNVSFFRWAFAECTAFNQDLSLWDVSNGTEFTSMFFDCVAFNQDLSLWDVSLGRSFGSMFYGATVFNSDISSWKTPLAESMFRLLVDAAAFTQDLSTWYVPLIPTQPFEFAQGSQIIDYPNWGVEDPNLDREIELIGIASNEAFGTAIITGVDQYITLNGIASTEAFGSLLIEVITPRIRSYKLATTLFGTICILPFEATVPCIEKLGWLTNIMTNYNGTENRIRIRAEPRNTLSYRYSEGNGKLAEATLNQYGGLQLNWAVPLWAEQEVIGSISDGISSITVDTTVADYRDNSLALIYESYTSWEVVEITTITSTLINTENPILYAYTNALIMPIRLGIIVGGVNKVGTGYSAITTILFDIIDTLALTPADTPEQFLGNDIYYDEPLTKGSSNKYNTKITTLTERVDFDLGLFDTNTPWSYNRVIRPYRWSIQGASDIRDFRLSLERRAGKLNVFWEPSFEADFKILSSGLIISTIEVSSIGQTDFDINKTHIAIQLTNGNWIPRTIINFTVINAVTMQIELDTSLNVYVSEIAYISYLGLKRFDTDIIELKWIGNTVVEATINILEIQP